MRRKLIAGIGMMAGAAAVFAANAPARAGMALGSAGHNAGSVALRHGGAHPGSKSRPAGGSGDATSLPAATETETGPVVQTRFGPVQVKVSFAGGRIVDSQAVRTPDDRRRSIMINEYAAPILRQETLTAQSAEIDLVSGATVTSDAYARSLQAAIDRAPR